MPVTLKTLQDKDEADAMLQCQVCFNEYSSNPSDYFMASLDHVFTCCEVPMMLVKKIESFRILAE